MLDSKQHSQSLSEGQLTPHLNEGVGDWLAGFDIDDLNIEMKRNSSLPFHNFGPDIFPKDVWKTMSEMSHDISYLDFKKQNNIQLTERSLGGLRTEDARVALRKNQSRVRLAGKGLA
jgi:hypothetical protein